MAMRCPIKGCGKAGEARVGVDLGPRWDDTTWIAASARFHQLWLCREHAALVVGNGLEVGRAKIETTR